MEEIGRVHRTDTNANIFLFCFTLNFFFVLAYFFDRHFFLKKILR